MSAMWNSGRLPSSIATRVPRPTPSSVSAAATRAARSPYSAYVSTWYSAPSFQRSAAASAWRSTVSRNRPVTVWPATRSSSCSRVTGPLVGLTVGPFPFRRSAGVRQPSYPQTSVENLWARVEKFGNLGDTVAQSVPRRALGRPLRRAPGSFSTPHLLGTYCCAGPTVPGPSRRAQSSGRSSGPLNSLAQPADAPPMRPHAWLPLGVAALRAPCSRARGPRRRADRGRARRPGRRRRHECVRRRLDRSRRGGGLPHAGDPGEPQQRDARAADDPARRDDAAARRARCRHRRHATEARRRSRRVGAAAADRPRPGGVHLPQRAPTTGRGRRHREPRRRRVRAEVRGSRDAHRRATDHGPQQAGRRARRQAQGSRVRNARSSSRSTTGSTTPRPHSPRSPRASRRCSTKPARSR